MKLSQINPKNIKGFIQGNFRKFMEDYPGVVDDFIYEQVQWRLGIMDENCLKNKQCPCTCDVPHKQYEDRSCEKGCYPPMFKTKEEWEQFKQDNEITKNLINHNLYLRKDLIWPTDGNKIN